MIAVLSWTRATAAGMKSAQETFPFPLLYDGPITAIARGTPTTVIFDKSGTSVAWKTGPCDWTSREVRVLLEALIK